MPKFRFKAKDLNNKIVKGVFFADSEDDLRMIISRQDYYLISCSKIAESSQMFSFLEKIKTEEISFFCRQFSIMLTSGMEISKAMEILKNNCKVKKLKNILEVVYADLMQGKMLSESFSKFPKTFPVFFRNMIAIGEVSGSLDKVLVSLADYYDKSVKTKRKVKSAMSYPIFLIILVMAVLAVISLVVMPTFQGVFNDLGAELPQISIIVIDVTSFLRNNFKTILLVAVALVVLFIFLKRYKSFSRMIDNLKLNAPVIGGVTKASITSTFTSGLCTLLNSGVSVIESLETMSRLLGNLIIEEKMRVVINEVKSGSGIAKSIETISFFPDLLIQMISVGERTGSLEEVLSRVTGYYEDQVELSIKKMTSAIEPLMIFFVAGIVIVVLLSVFLPMLSMMSAIDQAGA